MADYTDIPTLITALAAGKAFTDEKAQALAENPEAIAEGAADAPRVQGRALDVWRGSYSFNSGAPDVIMDLENHDFFRAIVTTNGVSTNLRIRLSNDNGSSWGSYQIVSAGGGAGVSRGELLIDLTGAQSLFVPNTGATAVTTVALTVPTDFNALEFSTDDGNTVNLLLFSLGGAP